jgi:hypothetical protein
MNKSVVFSQKKDSLHSNHYILFIHFALASLGQTMIRTQVQEWVQGEDDQDKKINLICR